MRKGRHQRTGKIMTLIKNNRKLKNEIQQYTIENQNVLYTCMNTYACAHNKYQQDACIMD